MRISEQTRFQGMLSGITMRGSRLNDLYEQLASQRAVNKPSDDLVKTGTIMRLGSQVKRLEQSVSAINAAQSFTDVATSSLTDCSDQVQTILALVVRAANETLSPNDLKSIGNDINQQLETLVQYANGNFEGRYLFSGARTDTPPVDAERDSNGDIVSLSYQGSSASLQFPIDSGRTFPAGATAQTAFFDTGLLDAVLKLRDDLRSADTIPSDELASRLSADLSGMSKAKDLFLNETGKLAARSAELDVLKSQAESAVTRAQGVISEVRDVDVAEIAMSMQREQTVYQAILAANAKIMSVNLFNYL